MLKKLWLIYQGRCTKCESTKVTWGYMDSGTFCPHCDLKLPQVYCDLKLPMTLREKGS